MDKDIDIKNLLLNIQSEIKEMNNKLNKIEKTSSNGNFAYTSEDVNSQDH